MNDQGERKKSGQSISIKSAMLVYSQKAISSKNVKQ